MTTKVVELQVQMSAIQAEVEKRRKKGRLTGSGSAESTSFVRVYYLPFVRFKFQYLKKSGLVSKKEITHYGDCFYRLAVVGSTTKNGKFVWEEEFYNLIHPELKTATISEKMHDGYFLPIALEQARTQLTELVNYLTTTMKNQFQEIESVLGRVKWHTSLSPHDKVQLADIKNGYKVLEGMENKLRKRLEMESEAFTFQRVTESEIVFVPWYVAKFTSKKTTRYLAFYYRGKEDDYFTSKLNGEYVIADFFENGFHDTKNTLLPSYDNRQHLNNGVENNTRSVFDNNPDHASLDNIRQTHGFETLQEAHLFSILSRTADKDSSISVSKVCDVMKQEEQSIDQTAYTRAFSTSESGLMAFINNNPKFAKWEAFYSGSQFKLVPQRIAIIDGSNVAYANFDRSIMGGRSPPSAENILRVAGELRNRGFYKIFVILDAGVEHSIASQSGYGEVKRMCQVVAAPARNKVDEYIIQYARLFSAYIITNDRFRDWKQSDEWVRSSIDKHLITYMILDGVVTFDTRLR